MSAFGRKSSFLPARSYRTGSVKSSLETSACQCEGLRHTAATLLLATGETPEWIMRQLGHSTTEMLFRFYSRYISNLTRQDGSAFESQLKRTLNKELANSLVLLMPTRHIIEAGLFNRQDFKLESEIFCAGKPTWYEFAGGYPRHDGLPSD